MNCPECGIEISDQAKACPHCGFRSKKKKPIAVIIIFAVLLIAALVIAVLTFSVKKPDDNTEGQNLSVTEPDEEEVLPFTEPTETQPATESEYDKLAIGDRYTLGKYEQNNITDGKEDISWLILDKKDGKVLLISEYSLDCKAYNETDSDVTWETCDLRKWLNNDFINTAFSAEEQAKISETTLTNAGNPDYGTVGGNDTNDKVFVLSEEEYNRYFPENSSSEAPFFAPPTDCAVANGAYKSDGSGENGARNQNTSLWWLRTPGAMQSFAVCIVTDGLKSDGAPAVNYWEDEDGGTSSWGACVRPAMWVTL